MVRRRARRARPVSVVVDRPARSEVVARRRYAPTRLITKRGAGRMNDVYVIEIWLGERLNVRNVYAADADDALHTHELHYPGEHIVSVQRGDGLSVR